MENSQVIILSLIGILSLFALSDKVFADSHNIPPISLSTELAIYGNGDNVIVTGNIRDYDSSSGGSLVFFIISPLNELVTIGQLVPNSDGSFEFSFIAGGPLWKSNGDYIVETKYGGNTNETIIIYTGGELVITTEPEPESTSESTPESTSESTPESKELKILAPFVDETKEPQSYVDRYNSEPSYKKWFDNNYSEYSSIYEAVGLEEPIMDPESTPVDKELEPPVEKEPEPSVEKEPEPPVDKEPEPPVDKEPEPAFAEKKSVFQKISNTIKYPFHSTAKVVGWDGIPSKFSGHSEPVKHKPFLASWVCQILVWESGKIVGASSQDIFNLASVCKG